ncbi:MAG TPA: ATP-binding protein [Gemmatimonadaceae bacterium]|nr:ATP-binding protein [Gemmatimonadaceae bacterium]
MARVMSNDMLRLKLAEALSAELPPRTARDIRVPGVPGKALAVIGVRRGGKTSFLYRRMAERLEAGEPAGTHLLVSLEDERLVGMTGEDLGWLLEEHRRVVPAVRECGRRTVYLDEVQVVAGWEPLVRRLLDAGDTEIFVSGSSARLLSREVHTALRGRSMEVLVHPFSFREALRHGGEEPVQAWGSLSPNERADLDAALRRFLGTGGFPEAQGIEARDRIPVLRSYVDVMVLRDVIERHAVSNVEALRRLQRHLLANPGGSFSVSRFHRDLKSQGLAVGEETLYHMLAHLEDAFLVRLVSMHTASERQRMRNPRKVYPIDPGLIPVYERAGRENRGRSLETAVVIELERRGYGVGWVRVGEDLEVDFHAEHPVEEPLLIQLSLDTVADATWEREIRSLERAAAAYPNARPLLITLDPTPPARPLPPRLEWRSATQWLLEGA